ncbi:MAG: DUF721 domain-containing protein [Bacteroidetes bacterium]|nr:DUF721 domain-containing protein [Bacteroidota bacterium]
MSKSFKDLGGELDQLLEQIGIRERVDEQRVLQLFETIMGASFCKRARAVKIERGILYIEVESSAWRQELFYQKSMIKTRLNEALGRVFVKDVIFR